MHLGWGKGEGHPREASVPTIFTGKGRAILGEDGVLTGLWPPDPTLANLLGNGDRAFGGEEAGGGSGQAMPRACKLPGSLCKRGLYEGDIPKWRQGAVAGGGRQGQGKECASGGGRPVGQEQRDAQQLC